VTSDEKEEELVTRAKNSARALRSDPPPEEEEDAMPPNSSDDPRLYEGVAASAEIGVLLLQKLGYLQATVENLQQRLRRFEEAEDTALSAILDERRSKLDIEEEITRTDLELRIKKAATEDELRKERAKRVGKLIAFIVSPLGVWKIVEFLQSLVH